jgi:apolipoprotein N-acyltransferase
LTLAAAPFGQWYLAYVALAPLLIAFGRAATIRGAIWRGWVAGLVYFGANLWWLWTASIAGTIVLVLYLALFWALFAAIVCGLDLLGSRARPEVDSTASQWQGVVGVLGIATIWVAVEWVRCNIAVDFPWLPLGSTQTPVAVMCQVVDIGGPWIVSFFVVLPSALIAVWWFNRDARSSVWFTTATVAASIVMVALYGVWRLETTETRPGPRVMVIQSNFPHLPGGAATVDRQAAVDFYLDELERSLASQPADLAILPEAAFPPLNDEARGELARAPIGPFLESTYKRLQDIARDKSTALLLGGNAVTGWSTRGTEHIGSEIRNSVYFFEPTGREPVARYDKIYLVRFAERTAISFGPQWLQRFLMGISAPRVSQPLYAGTLADFRPFRLTWTDEFSGKTHETYFISPICLENLGPMIVTKLMRDPSPDRKFAGFIANVSNDGWFANQEKHQHWQSIVFRCIENRVPMVRSSNTGISGFVDSAGRVEEMIAPSTAGFAVRQIWLDGRRTFYAQYGDVFAYACVAISVGAIVAVTFMRWLMRR